MRAKAKKIAATLCILFFMQDFLAHFISAQQNAWVQWMLMYRVWAATDRYVKSSCANVATYNPALDTCTGGSALVYSTIADALSPSSAGDQIYIRAGTYVEAFTTAQFSPKSSTSYATALTVQGYQSEVVIIRPSAGTTCLSFGNDGSILRYFIFKNFICDGAANSAASDVTAIGIGGGANGGTIDHLKFENVLVRNWTGNGYAAGGDDSTGNFLWFTGSAGGCLNVGTSTTSPTDRHCWYVEGSDIIVEHQLCENVGIGYCVHNYGPTPQPSRNVYRFNRLKNAGLNTSQTRFAMVLTSGSNNEAYGNDIFNSQNGIDLGGTGQRLYNNTLYGNGIGFGCPGVDVCYPAINAASGSGHQIGNNLIIGNQLNSINTTGSSGNTVSNNTTTGTAAQHFADATNGDFRLCTAVGVPLNCPSGASAAIDSGMTLGAPYNVDRVGTLRPLGVFYDAGALESGGAGGPSCPSTPVLVAQYGFDGSANDSSGNSNNGSLGSGVTFAAGRYSQGANFTGKGAISIANSTSLWICEGFTIGAWVKPSNSPTDYAAVAVKNYKYYLYSSSSGLCGAGAPIGGYNQGGDVAACYGTPLTQDAWAYVTVTYDKTTIRLWVNGANVSNQAATATLDQTAGSLQIGGSEYGEFFQGLIDEVRIYNYARSGAQIIADMNTPINPLSAPVELQLSGSSTISLGSGAALTFGNR